jgi:hypothetical protein
VTETPLVLNFFFLKAIFHLPFWADHLVYVEFMKEGCFLFGFFVGII